MAKNKAKKPQGHPARVARDDTNVEIEKLSMRLTKLVPIVIRDKRFDPEDVIIAKATATGALHLYSVLEDKPSPYELYKQQMAHARKAIIAIEDLHERYYKSSSDETYGNNPMCRECEVAYPCPTRQLISNP